MADPPLSVIIVTLNSRQEIDACLASLFADLGERQATSDAIVNRRLQATSDAIVNQRLQARVIVVDNASTDGTAAHIAAQWPQVTLLAQAENRGFAAANNIGLAHATGDAVLLLNPDTVIQPGALPALLAVLDVRSEVGIIGPMLVNANGSPQSSCRDFPSLLGDLVGMTELYRVPVARRLLRRHLSSLDDECRPRRVDWLSGACLLVRRAAIDAVGSMDEGFFMYSEEMEWQYRMAQRGWVAWFEPAARVLHLGGASTAAFSGERIIWQYQSIWRFYRMYRSASQRFALRWIVWVATLPKITYLAWHARGNAHRQELLRAFWRVLWLA